MHRLRGRHEVLKTHMEIAHRLILQSLKLGQYVPLKLYTGAAAGFPSSAKDSIHKMGLSVQGTVPLGTRVTHRGLGRSMAW